MGKSSDDDKEAYEWNGRSLDEEEEGLSPTLRAFCHFVTSAKFRSTLAKFFESNCADFEEASLDAEQRLEWTQVYEAYTHLIEEQLDVWSSCREMEPQAVVTMLRRACKSGTLDDEFLPAVLGLTEYSFFIEQMGITARHNRYYRQALREIESKDANFSGVWRLATKDGSILLTDVKQGLDRYLTALGLPPSLFNLFRATLFSQKGLVVIHDDDRLTIIADTLTGRQKQDFVADGRRRDLPTLAGTTAPFRVTWDDRNGRVVVRNEKPSGLPAGAAIVHTWELNGKYLKCTSEVERPNGVVLHEFFYVRHTPSCPVKHKKSTPKEEGRHK